MPDPQNSQIARVLLVEDSPSDARLLQLGLSQAGGFPIEVTAVERLDTALAALREHMFDIALLDLGLPDSNGLATFRRVQSEFPHIPIVILTGADNETDGAAAIRLGVQDYLVKGKADARAVARSIRYAIERKRGEQSFKRAAERFKLLSDTAAGLLTSEEPQSIVNGLCRDVMAHLDCQVFFNFLVDEPSGRLRLNGCAGVPEAEARKVQWLDFGVAVCGCVARDRKRIIVEDIQNTADPRADLVRSLGVRACCCHPLIAEGRLLGTLAFGTTTRPSFTPEEIETMRVVADEVALAMQRVQAQDQLRALNESLERRVTERTVEARHLTDQLRALAMELTQAEQIERRRLAQILHDHIQQLLVACKIQVGISARDSDTPRRAQAMERINSLIQEAIESCRSLTVELSPPILHQAGLGAGLEWLAHRLERQSQFEVEVHAEPEAEPQKEDVSLLLFDCARELLLNSLKHSGVRRSRVSLTLAAEGWTRLVVEDAGAGFDPGAVSASAERGGFGLFSIQQRLRHMGGRLEIESAPGQGARVCLLIPPQAAEAPAAEAPAPVPPSAPASAYPTPPPPSRARKIRVLLADDHKILRQGIASLLKLDEHIDVVGEAGDGAEALELAHRLRPDVVIMDVTMPRMSGVEATRRIAIELPRIRVIALSMHSEADMADAMREAGAVEYLTKGGPSEALIGAIRTCAERPSPRKD